MTKKSASLREISIDIFIPVYNEGQNIKRLLYELDEKVKVPYELIIVYDSEDDNTLPVIHEIEKNYFHKIHLVRNFYGKGANGAFRTGMKSVKNEAIVFTMADLSDSIETINEMVEQIENGYDMVAGSRYIEGGSKENDSIIKTFLSKSAGKSLYFLAGIPIHDISNGFKMYRREVVEQIELESKTGFEVIVELAVKTFIGGYKITEVPAQWRNRDTGKSSFRMWKWLPHYLYWYLYAIFEGRLRRRE